jgi:hypothetical protein
MFCAPRPIFGGTESIGSRFHALCSRTHFERYRERRVQFSCFAFPDLFWVAPRDGGSYFLVFRSQTRFGQYQGRRVSFSCYALLDSFWAVTRAPGPFLIFCALIVVFSGNESVESNFHVLRSRSHFRRYRARLDLKGCSG